MVKWNNFFGEENVLMEGKGDDVFHVIPDRKDEEGNSTTVILSKKSILEFAKQLQEN